MTVHLAKVCVGATGVESLQHWQDSLVLRAGIAGEPHLPWHVTRMYPRRDGEILDGGSLYWTIGGYFAVRQRIVSIERVRGDDQIERCRLNFDPELVLVEPVPRRAFQGWRYLKVEDAPADLSGNGAGQEVLQRQLAELGLL